MELNLFVNKASRLPFPKSKSPLWLSVSSLHLDRLSADPKNWRRLGLIGNPIPSHHQDRSDRSEMRQLSVADFSPIETSQLDALRYIELLFRLSA